MPPLFRPLPVQPSDQNPHVRTAIDRSSDGFRPVLVSLLASLKSSDGGQDTLRRLDARFAAIHAQYAVEEPAAAIREPCWSEAELARLARVSIYSVEYLAISQRNALVRAGIGTMGDLFEKTEAELRSIPDFGETGTTAMVAVLAELGLSLKTKSD